LNRDVFSRASGMYRQRLSMTSRWPVNHSKLAGCRLTTAQYHPPMMKISRN